MHYGPSAAEDAQSRVRLHLENVRCDAISGPQKIVRGRNGLCVGRDLGRMILIPFARCGETQPPLLFAIQVNSPGNYAIVLGEGI